MITTLCTIRFMVCIDGRRYFLLHLHCTGGWCVQLQTYKFGAIESWWCYRSLMGRAFQTLHDGFTILIILHESFTKIWSASFYSSYFSLAFACSVTLISYTCNLRRLTFLFGLMQIPVRRAMVRNKHNPQYCTCYTCSLEHTFTASYTNAHIGYYPTNCDY